MIVHVRVDASMQCVRPLTKVQQCIHDKIHCKVQLMRLQHMYTTKTLITVA